MFVFLHGTDCRYCASGTETSRFQHLYTTDLTLSCIEGDGLCSHAPPDQSEGLHVASPLCNLSNGDVGVRAKNLIVKRVEIPCSQKKKKYTHNMHLGRVPLHFAR